MALTGQDIVTRALAKANDESAAYWQAAESLRNVNDAQRAVVSRLPQAGATAAMPTLAAGSRQTLAGLSLQGFEVLDVVCNVSGSTRGTPIHKGSRTWLDDNVPTWHTDSAAGAAEIWTQDERDPTAFYIWPHNGAKAEVIYAALPTDLTNISQAIGVNDIYADAMQWYVLFAMYAKDLSKLKSQQQAQTYWSLFLSALGLRDESITKNAAAGSAKEMGA